jgi:predicted small lipoprotein YifL
MVRHSRRTLALVAALVLTVAMTGCGIKGPLTSAPKPDPAKDATKPAPLGPVSATGTLAPVAGRPPG